jgi:allantoate deiminase
MELLDELGQIGRQPGQEGVTRPGLSAPEQAACELVAGWFEQEGLAVSWDGAGNLFGRIPGATGAETWCGSHLDTVPNGGRFDGALGVVVGLAAVARLVREARPPAVAVVVFRDEEGWRFGNGCFGSRAVCGLVDEGDLAVEDAGGTSIHEALAQLGFDGHVDYAAPRRYLEVHIEQGPVLDGMDAPVGVVAGISGMAGFRCSFHGSGGHAGTVPMAARGDAFSACADFALRLSDHALALETAVATVGDVTVADPAANVIPAHVHATVDVRAPAPHSLMALCEAVPSLASEAASRHGCRAEVAKSWESPPVDMSPAAVEALRQACGAELPLLRSGAGHDAGVLAASGVEAGMLFVRSRAGGVSHRPDELTAEADVAVAVDVLEGALRRLA